MTRRVSLSPIPAGGQLVKRDEMNGQEAREVIAVNLRAGASDRRPAKTKAST
ncbi:MAG: hypothetical protein U0P30_00015 [Vicinamibacterales bacterium]